MDFQRFVGGKPHQAGAVLLVPARARPLGQLFLGDAHEPGAEYLGLLRVERCSFVGKDATAQQHRQQAEASD
ncbi:hypothetical protein D3C87_1880210 [compost metagenome]